tara:strand:+ start:147 stop:557 length:411 start_codon:yes stop_codon:yes gene_type:complete
MKTSCVIILKKKQHYLLQLRDNKKKVLERNQWGFFGGQKSKYESKLSCIKREIQEELNFKIKYPKFVGQLKYKNYLINIFFMTTKKKFFEINEGSAYGFYNKSQILKNNCKLKNSSKKYLVAKSSLKVFKYFLKNI